MKVRMGELIRAVCFNANGLKDEYKRRMVIESCMKGRVDVLGLSETHLSGVGAGKCGVGSECGRWEGMVGGAVWMGLDDGYRGRGKEGCAILMSERVWKCVTDYGWKGSRIVWVKCKLGIIRYAWVCVYAPVNMKTTNGRKEMEKFWNELNECVNSFEEGRKVIVMGDMNAKVGDECMEDVVGKWGVPGWNENGEWLVDVCAERGLFLANTFFPHKMIHRYTWRRAEQKGLIDYMAVDKSLKRDVTDAKVVRGMFDCSDHFAVLMKLKMRDKWIFGRVEKGERRRLRSERFREREVREEYKNVLTEELESEREMLYGERNVEVMYEILKTAVRDVTERVVGTKVVRKRKKKGNAWWTDEVKEAVEKKREAYKKTLERNVPERVRNERKRVYVEYKRRVKQVIQESKRRTDEDFGRQLSEKYKEDKRLYWKEVKNERKREMNESNDVKEVKDEDGRILKEKEAVKERWKEYFEDLMNVKNKDEAIVICMGITGRGGAMWDQEQISRGEVVKAINSLKMGKAAGVDGITAEMLKYGGESVIEWMHRICQMAWEEEKVPDDWTKAVIIPVYKGKGERNECGSHRGISLMSIAGKVYGKIVIERVQKITERCISEEQGAFRKGRGCVDQIFSLRMIVEKMLAKGKKVYAAFMDLEKAYDRVDWKAMWDVLKVYGVGGKLLNGVKAFYRNASACVRIDGEMSDCFAIKGGVRQGCVMSPWLFNLYMDGVIREMKAGAVNAGVELCTNDGKWLVNTILFADDTVLIAKSGNELQRLVNLFDSVCRRRKLKVNVSKSKVMVFERCRRDVIDFECPYRVRLESPKELDIRLNGERMGEVDEFKYLGSVFCKDGSMDGEMRERAIQGRKVIGSLGRMMRERTVSNDVKKGLRDGIIVPTLTYASETWVWNERQRSRIQAVEMSFLRGACGVGRMDGESNERVYERLGMSSKGEGVKCGVVEWVKRNTLRWFGHIERMDESVMTKKVYKSIIEDVGIKGQPPMKWEDRVHQYVRERSVSGIRGLKLGESARTRIDGDISDVAIP